MDERTGADRFRPEYLFEDPPAAADAPLSDYTGLDFVSHGSRLYGEIMWPDGGFAGARPCVILLHGFPGTARNDDLAHALCRSGCVTLTPHHRGAWGSEGEYLVTNCIEDARALAGHVRGEAFAAQYHIDPERVYLLGHSIGACTAIHAAQALPRLRGLILLAPYDPTLLLRQGRIDEMRDFLEEGRCLRGSMEAVYDDIVRHRDALAFPAAAEALRNRNLLCVTGAQDAVAPARDMFLPLWERLRPEESGAVQRFVELPAGHGLQGCRVRLTRLIARFIADTL